MNTFSHVRRTVLGLVVAALVLMGGLSAFVSASTVKPSVGHTGEALALRIALHPETAQKIQTAFLKAGLWPHAANGRFLADPKLFKPRRIQAVGTNPNPILISEGTQTLDVFAPPPSFTPVTGPLAPTNLTPVWSADESYLVFSSNRDATGNIAADGKFHIWAVLAKGGQVAQITTGPGNEYFPALNPNNNSILAFTSDANSPGNQNLYVIGGQTGVPFVPGQAPINVTALTGPATAKTLGAGNLMGVTRSTFSPGSDRLVFAATTPINTPGQTGGVSHLYYLYLSNNGYQPQPAPGAPNPPAQLTDGPASDTDPAWSPNGNFIVFASTATGITSPGAQIGPGSSPTITAGPSVGKRLLFMLSGNNVQAFGTVPPSLVPVLGRITPVGGDNFGPAWSFNVANQYTNPRSAFEFLSFASAPALNANHDIYYFRLTTLNTDQTITITPETALGGSNPPIHLNTSDPGNLYDNTYPTWAPFLSVFSIAYQSPRSVTYNTPGTNVPVETAINVPRDANGPAANGSTVSPIYFGLLESQVLNLDPPSLLRYSGSEVVHVADQNGNTTRNIQPSTPSSRTTVSFTVRLSNREAGIDESNLYLQIKDPDSKYQDSQGLEHKVFANSNDVQKNPAGGGGTVPLGGGTALNLPQFNGNTNQLGAIGGWDPKPSPGVVIRVGHQSAPSAPGGNAFDPSLYRSWGPEYECQWVNPTHLDPSSGLTTAGDYGVPYYLAGVDDQSAFSGSTHPPRPTVDNPAAPDTRDQFAQWLHLTRVPDAGQDGQGGVLYTATYTTPISASDFYVDVIAYDNAVFPAFPADVSPTYNGQSKNWRIYDNVGGFTTATFNGNNDILVVVDNALGQKFSATTFGGQNGNSNLVPFFYGAESYYTDVDENLLPNATQLFATVTAPAVPAIPDPARIAAPDMLVATPGNGQITLTWRGLIAGPANAPVSPTQYNVYRSLNPGVPNGPGATPFAVVPGTSPTTYLDRNLNNGTPYYYVVTAVFGASESGPSNEASATPQDFTAAVRSVKLLSPFGNGNNGDQVTTLNALGVGSYIDSLNDDGGRVAEPTANLPNGTQTVSNVKAKRYSIWRILSRGAIPQSVLAGYQAGFQAQPAINDVVNKVSAPAAPAVPVAPRCVIWVSPYTGDLPLVDAGSLENPTTQDSLKSYVASGGRLCITGQDVANAVSLGGSVNNTFLTTTLGVNFVSNGNGSQTLGGDGHRISGFPGFGGSINGSNGGMAYNVYQDGTGIQISTPPSAGPLLLGNDYVATSGLLRADASLGQIGPYPIGLSPGLGGRTVITAIAAIDTVTASGNATGDFTTGGARGLFYYENYNTNADGTPAVNAGYGSRVVFGSFGLEGISQDYYRYDVNNVTFYSVRNQRAHVLNNIVTYLRTGAFTGRITQASGQGVPGATVYLRPGGSLPGPRNFFSATSNFDGSFTIAGVEPGNYSLAAYKSGFTTSVSNVNFGVEADSTTNASLVLAPVPPGRIQGTVKDSVSGLGVAGVTVTFKSTDGQTTVFAVTGADGTYTIDNVPAGVYNGTASKQPQYQDAAAPTQGNPITVPSGGTAPADFSVVPNPATVSGVVFNDIDGDGNRGAGEPGIPGATVTFTPTQGAGTPVSATSGADGSYTVTVSGGTYTISVTASGYRISAPRTLVVQPGDARTGVDIPLIPVPVIPNGTLGGLVVDGFTGQPLTGVTITVTNAAGAVAATATTGAAASPAAPQGDGLPLNYGPISLPPGTYTVTAARTGFTGQTLTGVIVASAVFTRADFSAATGNPLQPLHVFPAGLNFVSFPYDYASAGVTFDTLFGGLNPSPRSNPAAGGNRSHVYVWQPQLLQYVADPTPPADMPRLGQGYWVYLINGVETFGVTNRPTAAAISVALHPGWNMIGVPSLTAVSVARLAFVNPAGTGAITFDQAVSSTFKLVSPTLYGFDGANYVPVTSGGALQPYQSYWIYAYVDTTIQIPTTGG